VLVGILEMNLIVCEELFWSMMIKRIASGNRSLEV
jgi:hypothetical protein